MNLNMKTTVIMSDKSGRSVCPRPAAAAWGHAVLPLFPGRARSPQRAVAALICSFQILFAFGADNARWVDPFIGTAGTGHCTPAAAYPFGMLQPGADTGNKGWDYCSGYLYSDTRIRGFCQTHLNGTGSTDLGDVGFFPFTGGRPKELSSAFSHARETASPGYYAVELDDFGLKAEATCSERVAYWRFTANNPIRVARLADYTMSGADNDPPTIVLEKRFNQVSDRVFEGWAKTKGWVEREYWYIIEFDRPVKFENDVWSCDAIELQMRVALSASSIAGARANLAAEGAAWDFDAVHRATRDLRGIVSFPVSLFPRLTAMMCAVHFTPQRIASVFSRTFFPMSARNLFIQPFPCGIHSAPPIRFTRNSFRRKCLNTSIRF
jgi:hypothetical protein